MVRVGPGDGTGGYSSASTLSKVGTVTIKVLGPDRKVVAEVNASDEVVTVPVPAGADGKVWSLSPHAHGHLWFFNAPNVLAASPDSLLLPKELVAADGLPTPKN